MKWFFKAKDGGPESTVTGYWLLEWKRGFSVVLLRFDGRSREAYHTHAFNAWSWVLKGRLKETFISRTVRLHDASIFPIFTARVDYHKVDSLAERTWVFSVRGPWIDHWLEHHSATNNEVALTHGRKILA